MHARKGLAGSAQGAEGGGVVLEGLGRSTVYQFSKQVNFVGKWAGCIFFVGGGGGGTG